jgi:hypothetical protein
MGSVMPTPMTSQAEHGLLHYRFPGKDSILDVLQRVSAYLVQLHLYIDAGRLGSEDTVVIVGCSALGFRQGLSLHSRSTIGIHDVV